MLKLFRRKKTDPWQNGGATPTIYVKNGFFVTSSLVEITAWTCTAAHDIYGNQRMTRRPG